MAFKVMIVPMIGPLIGFALAIYFMCHDWDVPWQTTTHAYINNESFQAEHVEWESGYKTHREKIVPDTWYLDVHTPKGDDWFAIRHAPWDWQQKGLRVDADYKISRSGKFRLLGIIKHDDWTFDPKPALKELKS